MDFVKKAASSLGNKEDKPQGENKPADGQQGGQPAGGDANKEDYLDKAFDAGSKKFGYNVNRDTSEKITDGARGAFEKATGKQVPEKFSN